MTTVWAPAHLARLADLPPQAARVIAPAQVRAIVPDVDLWDFWPVQERDGTTARFGAVEMWMALGAPAIGASVERHDRARIRLLDRSGDAWRDRGDLLPDGFGPGSREWSGSAIVDAGHEVLTLYFTAAGRCGEVRPTFEQRLFETRARLHGTAPHDWTPPRQSVASDGEVYHPAAQAHGRLGTIKAFRDPAWFADPADGARYLVFTASLGQSASAFNGAIGIARCAGNGWTLLPPLIAADGVNNELERPHMLVQGGRYYLFWSTQRSVFAPGIDAPTGLYGMVSDALFGPYAPLNGSGLVFANPPDTPAQAYSWLVSADLTVSSFIDAVGIDAFECGLSSTRHGFAPELRLALEGTTARLIA